MRIIDAGCNANFGADFGADFDADFGADFDVHFERIYFERILDGFFSAV